MITYKYLSGNAALRCLSEDSIYFASPGEMNDLLEGQYDLATSNQFVEMFNSAVHEISVGRNKHGKISAVDFVPEELKAVIDRENRCFHDAAKRVGIYSTAKRFDNQPMWAHYCNSFRGVCFELSWSKGVIEKNQLFPVDVIYWDRERNHNRALDFKNLLIAYGQKNPEWTLQQLFEHSMSEEFRRQWGVATTARAVSIKHPDWSYEDEVRIVAPKSGAQPLLRDILKRVYFVESDFSEWVSIVRLLYQLYPETDLVQLSFLHKPPFVRGKHIEFKTVPVQS